MCSEPHHQAESAYQEAVVAFSSGPHLLLRLYEQLLLQLRQAQRLQLTDQPSCQQHILQAQLILQQILNLLRPAHNPAIYLQHQALLRELLQMQQTSPTELSQVYAAGVRLYQNWCQQLNLKRRLPSQILNVRRLSDPENPSKA